MNTKHMLLAASLTAALPAVSVTAFAKDTPLEAGQKDDVAWDIVEGMTTEIGQRQGGTEAEARSRTWSVAKLKSLGLANARIEEFQMPTWVRGEETGFVTAPFPHKLHIAALGNSGSTAAAGLEAEVVYFKTIAAQKLGIIDLQQEGTKYFDLHHTPDDTLDKIDKDELRQNVAAWAATLSLVANYDGALKPEPKP